MTLLFISSTKISPTHKGVWKKLLCELDFVLIVQCCNISCHLMATNFDKINMCEVKGNFVIPLATNKKKKEFHKFWGLTIIDGKS